MIIAIEPCAHQDVEEAAIDHDLPFLTEKPMTLDLHQAEEIARRVEKRADYRRRLPRSVSGSNGHHQGRAAPP